MTVDAGTPGAAAGLSVQRQRCQSVMQRDGQCVPTQRLGAVGTSLGIGEARGRVGVEKTSVEPASGTWRCRGGGGTRTVLVALVPWYQVLYDPDVVELAAARAAQHQGQRPVADLRMVPPGCQCVVV